MSRPTSVLAVAALALLLAGSSALAGKPAGRAKAKDPLLGTWQAEAIERKGSKRKVEGMELLAIFERGGRFVSVVKDDHHGERRRTGRWKRTARNRITTVVGKRTDRAVYRIDGKRLVLRNAESGQRLFLRRVK